MRVSEMSRQFDIPALDVKALSEVDVEQFQNKLTALRNRAEDELKSVEVSSLAPNLPALMSLQRLTGVELDRLRSHMTDLRSKRDNWSLAKEEKAQSIVPHLRSF